MYRDYAAGVAYSVGYRNNGVITPIRDNMSFISRRNALQVYRELTLLHPDMSLSLIVKHRNSANKKWIVWDNPIQDSIDAATFDLLNLTLKEISSRLQESLKKTNDLIRRRGVIKRNRLMDTSEDHNSISAQIEELKSLTDQIEENRIYLSALQLVRDEKKEEAKAYLDYEADYNYEEEY